MKRLFRLLTLATFVIAAISAIVLAILALTYPADAPPEDIQQTWHGCRVAFAVAVIAFGAERLLRPRKTKRVS